MTQDSLQMLMEVIFSPYLFEGKFLNDYVESEKNNLIDLINGRINDKRTYAIVRCIEEMCKDEHYGVYEYGDVDEVNKITAQSLYNHYKNLLENAKIIIFCIGRFDENAVANKFKPYFSKPRKTSAIETNIINRAKEQKNINEKIEVEQAKLSLGFRTDISANDEDMPALTLFSSVYGGVPHGKLFENVREKLSLCYYCASRIEKHKGLMIVYSGIDEKNKEKAQNEILKQLDSIKNGEVSEEELEDAKKSLTDAYKSASDSIMNMEDWYLGQILSGNGATLDEESEKINRLSVDDVINAAKKISLDTIYLLAGEPEKEGK